jgi:ABC-2 type transport system ATP-binding protein
MVSASHVSLSFRRGARRRPVQALDDVCLDIAAGEFFALVGRNGAGKTSFVHCLLGLIRPSSGDITILGRTPSPGASLFDQIAYLPEEPHYHGYLTVGEALDYYGSLLSRRPSPATKADLIDRFGLGEFLDRRLDRCSKGMKQKFGLAQCLLGNPELLLLDEPMRGLDPLTVRELRDGLVERHRAGATIIMNSHQLAEVETLATRVGVLDRGRIVAHGAVSDLVTLDRQQYVVECDVDELPEYFSAERHLNGSARGTVPADRLYDFMDFMKARGGRVTTCSLRRVTLEDSFVSLVEHSHA